jgi:hypothetical protein
VVPASEHAPTPPEAEDGRAERSQATDRRASLAVGTALAPQDSNYPRSWISVFILLKKYFILVTTKYTVSPHPFILYIILYLLWGPLITLSKYIHVTSCYEVFIETNLMV